MKSLSLVREDDLLEELTEICAVHSEIRPALDVIKKKSEFLLKESGMPYWEVRYLHKSGYLVIKKEDVEV